MGFVLRQAWSESQWTVLIMGYLTISTNVRPYQTHHRWQVFSSRKTAHRCIVYVTQSNWVKVWFSCFPVLLCSAEAQVISGGIVRRLLIAYFIGNISAKKYRNPFMCVKVIASQRWDVFETWCSNQYEKDTMKYKSKVSLSCIALYYELLVSMGLRYGTC